MSLRLLFVADTLADFKPAKDSTLAMMRACQRRGHHLAACQVQDLHWHSGAPVSAWVQALELTERLPDWYQARAPERLALRDFDAVLMRKDPPVDSEYFYATHLLSQAEREGARVFNRPQALREHPEKLALLEFAQFAPPTLVSRSAAELRAFHAEHGDIILKPLDGMGGKGIFRVRPDGLNLGATLETLGAGGQTTLMAQRYLPEIAAGDKRILLVDGEPAPVCLARIPQGGEVRGNLAAGGKGVAQPLSARDWALARALGPTLAARGLLLVGLDVIGDWVTEINVTSPTCMQEIEQQSGCDVAALFVAALERRVAVAPSLQCQP